MKYLYVDNYRGFSNTFIPIVDVNFMVGENSTGKSSILALLNLLSKPEFWFNQEFNTPEVELGTFRDIVSMNSSDNYFQIGVIECDDKEEFPTEKCNVFLSTYREEKGVPKIKDYSFISGDKQIRIVFSSKGSSIKYKISKIESTNNNITSLLRSIFDRWLEKPAGNGSGYKIFSDKERPITTRSPFVIVRATIQQLSVNEKDDDEVLEFSSIFEFESPSFTQRLTWIAPIRTKPSRIYGGLKSSFSPEGEHTPDLIKNLLNKEKTSNKFRNYTHDFGIQSGLFEELYIKSFGRTLSSPFELGVVLNGRKLRISDVGYGVSQSLPIIVEFFARPKNTWFAVQQPEVHLHPKAQAALGNLFLDLAITDGKRFFVETHSDYTINRFRTCYRDNEEAKSISSQVLFFERGEEGNKIHIIPIQSNGDYDDGQPESFRSFFINEELKNLGI